MTNSPALSFCILCVLLLAGCQSRNAYLPQETTKYSIEGTDKFVLLDPTVHAAITCTGLQEHLNQDGRLEVVANVKNRARTALRVRVRCLFKDANGFAIKDETPWQILDLNAGATEAVQFTARNKLAHKYTVFVRSAP